MDPQAKKTRKRETMARIKAVQAILRQWDPIGVAPGEFGPADEYDSYGPRIVSMADAGCTVDQLAAHLTYVRTQVIGVESDPTRDRETAAAILEALRVRD